MSKESSCSSIWLSLTKLVNTCFSLLSVLFCVLKVLEHVSTIAAPHFGFCKVHPCGISFYTFSYLCIFSTFVVRFIDLVHFRFLLFFFCTLYYTEIVCIKWKINSILFFFFNNFLVISVPSDMIAQYHHFIIDLKNRFYSNSYVLVSLKLQRKAMANCMYIFYRVHAAQTTPYTAMIYPKG